MCGLPWQPLCVDRYDNQVQLTWLNDIFVERLLKMTGSLVRFVLYPPGARVGRPEGVSWVLSSPLCPCQDVEVFDLYPGVTFPAHFSMLNPHFTPLA